MSSQLQQVLHDVKNERTRQDINWGGTDHDDAHGTEDWNRYIKRYNEWAAQMADMGSPTKYRNRMIQVAALAIAAVESHDRKFCIAGLRCDGGRTCTSSHK